MKEDVSIDTKQTKLSTRIVALIVSMVLIGISIVRRSIYGGLIGAMIIAAMLLTKKTYVCEEGLVVLYDVIVYKYKEVWPWEDILEIHRELSPDGKKYALHFMKEVMSKRLVYDIPQAKAVMTFAKEMNPEIHFGDVND